MVTLRYIGPLDGVDIPLLGKSVARGDQFDATKEHADLLLEQPANYELVPAKKKG